MIKVGDKFRWIGETTEYYTNGSVYEVIAYNYPNDGDDHPVVMDDNRRTERHHWSIETMKGKFVSCKSPIITKTVRELRPGTYGRLHVSPWMGLSPMAQIYIVDGGKFTSQELREAANTFIEIADYLDEQP